MHILAPPILICACVVIVGCNPRIHFSDEGNRESKDNPAKFQHNHATHFTYYANEEGRSFHKIKKIKKKMLLFCLLGGGYGRFRRSVDIEKGRFFIPIVQQQTDVHIDNGYGDAGHIVGHKPVHDSSGMFACQNLIGNILEYPFLSHPILATILGGGASSSGSDTTDGDNDKRIRGKHTNYNYENVALFGPIQRGISYRG